MGREPTRGCEMSHAHFPKEPLGDLLGKCDSEGNLARVGR